ncbi:S66 family peptidase [Liquorilactobacillus mali]|uniref:Microcin C7 immunity protein n=1 Tax=Liquorilactobacillus mali KCTC 3596 = DSM 20444 TaxID=1046596 RepID=J0UTB5_9LACO|nr:S66 peptidase family protein [Liquorilactobacillus mali]EJF00645.1 microcin C7 immunity protein [Liquorilactobacillus mali KCTC 3596 = DSM 20444]KRN10150.1 microcin C7 immunity protein [Liquorilactobacillus mali KCTC 3596 = DSM 20444]MDC7953020.1 LD-carboxypeptidase [Liquorilactobacillus mali]QFQ74024.1 LD-carboxypeptidase [Liquorilactobacillus mali]
MNIGFYTSSTPITVLAPKRFERALKFLKSKGVKLTTGSLTGKIDRYRSGTILERAQEINELIHNPEVNIIMSTIGGTNTNSVLPYIDYEYLKKHPKIFVGYSDTTALLLAVKTKAPECRILYGPAVVSSFGEWEPLVEETWNYFEKVVNSKYGESIITKAPLYWTDEKLDWEDFEHEKNTVVNKWHYTNESTLKGRIIGRNLNTMYGFIASEYFPKLTANDILLIEDAEKDASTVEKNFAMLKLAGVFDNIKGIILGKHALFDGEGTSMKPIDILQEVLGDKQIPIIYDYDSSHTVPMMTTPLGADATIDAETMSIEFTNY